jgi:hypothetical protein
VDTSIDSTNFMLQSLKRLDKTDDLAEMDEAEFITDARPSRKYETDITPPEKAQHSKVFLKHAKVSPSAESRCVQMQPGKPDK